MKLQTFVDIPRLGASIGYGDRIFCLGSCFADQMGRKMREAGLDVTVNPFGTLYNPVSLGNAIARLSSGVPFSEAECTEMGAGAGLVCSFSHHTSFARPTAEAFLQHANEALQTASEAWRGCNRVVLTLGTAWCFRLNATGETVSNCLKRPASEFTRYRLTPEAVATLLGRVVERHPDKHFLFTVSPIRHLADGAPGNQLSKSVLLLAVEHICKRFPAQCEYFPAYEIFMDELRDYRFYAEDMVHPSAQAVDYLWERFIEATLPAEERPVLEAKLKEFKRLQHRPIA